MWQLSLGRRSNGFCVTVQFTGAKQRPLPQFAPKIEQGLNETVKNSPILWEMGITSLPADTHIHNCEPCRWAAGSGTRGNTQRHLSADDTFYGLLGDWRQIIPSTLVNLRLTAPGGRLWSAEHLCNNAAHSQLQAICCLPQRCLSRALSFFKHIQFSSARRRESCFLKFGEAPK